MRKKLLILASMVMVIASSTGLLGVQKAYATSTKIRLCHATSSGSNPYTEVEVDDDSIYKNGGHGTHHSNRDIIPPFTEPAYWSHREYHPAISHAGLNWDAQGQKIWNNGCNVPVEPSKVTFVDITCNKEGSYTIPRSDHFDYYKDGHKIFSGTYKVYHPTTITIKARADNGYFIDGTKEWSHTFTAPDCSIIATQVVFNGPTCDSEETRSSFSYTIPSVAHVKYFIGRTEQVAGTFSANIGTSITVKAIADRGYSIEGVSEWISPEFSELTEEDCTLGVQDVTPVAPTFTPSTCDLLGYYTIPTTEGIKYYVDGKVISADKYTVANGKSVTINAIADEGYSIKDGATNQWSYTFNAPTNCGNGSGSVLGATTLANTDGDPKIAVFTIATATVALITVLGSAIRNLIFRQF